MLEPWNNHFFSDGKQGRRTPNQPHPQYFPTTNHSQYWNIGILESWTASGCSLLMHEGIIGAGMSFST
jgi:hypothetical protein